MNILNLFFFPFVTAFSLAFFATPLIIKFAYKTGIVDDPKKHRHSKVIHTYPVPRGGGIAIFIASFIAMIIFLPLDSHIVAILMGAAVLTVMGFLDDKYDINPYKRLIIQFLAASIPIISGIGIAFISNPISGGTIDLSNPQFSINLFGETRNIWIISDLFALLWIVVLMNFLNMGAKGVDGQLPGVAGISALAISALSLKYSADITQWPVIVLSMILAGSFLGFLPYNAYPQKIMPGFSGSNLAGYYLGILSILSTTKVGTLLIVLGIPIVDTAYTIMRRILSGKSPVWGDRGHLHHKLLDLGLSKRQVSYFYWISTAVLGIISLFLTSSYKLYTVIGIAVLLGGFFIWLTYRSKS
ncbi:MAG: glycosyl transferase family protein, UDP-N-acetylglucosamine:undecaprenyl-P N-acetylglucosaminyl 1-P transferase [Candidatus Woesebacteria bacterium GW2011_GWC1_38_13]|uniref:Glycosyl transferase family protein, UDP-N-acetylglucosamine:undecaprenyl-P N-acetylglucosaminyl 1-P transferase n=3 Tax=Candidatus Woeseibacteriota TaxID=1752722 RepID=A0A0G0LQ81_9BACT|nr:MAG: UDP-N-acetylmuramyl pentapeptide phosphotransferase/UDP-N-acetylglucosamine-1-phosphate transferase [Candidatus Woesebacteria bacterium GW2011_GWD1_38_10]KKQ54746.1 MAG: glycosyl transferase family protein, UDP-N-acetylglucosamine:undecaprenyl-P N-acetylglucosaminyl 1-P transferase [Candidatus Woesebacteria bacterium GW2011_GWC1_38_13]